MAQDWDFTLRAYNSMEFMECAMRSMFDELMDGIAEMKAYREGKITLRCYKVEPKGLPKPKSKRIRVGAPTHEAEPGSAPAQGFSATILPSRQ